MFCSINKFRGEDGEEGIKESVDGEFMFSLFFVWLRNCISKKKNKNLHKIKSIKNCYVATKLQLLKLCE
jgi:hypothetical protein